jgi:DNA-directed RNA polymerase subunit L
MNPILLYKNTKQNVLCFQLSNTNVSFANALRRTILSDIPVVVFKTFPYSENTCNIINNTTEHHNEIIKQRLCCLPILFPKSFHPNDFELYIHQQNTSARDIILTSEHFQIRNKKDNIFLPREEVAKIFPPCPLTNYFIEFAHLRCPKEGIAGDILHLTCDFSVGCAYDDGAYNVVSLCTYKNTIDFVKLGEVLQTLIAQWTLESKNIEFEKQNWLLLDGKRIIHNDSFDFAIETIGHYTNEELVIQACQLLMQRLDDLVRRREFEIVVSDNTMSNCYDIVLKNIDYTIGKALEYTFHVLFFETNIVQYCGFQKKHPHDNFVIIRLSYNDHVDTDLPSLISDHLHVVIHKTKEVFESILFQWDELRSQEDR